MVKCMVRICKVCIFYLTSILYRYTGYSWRKIQVFQEAKLRRNWVAAQEKPSCTNCAQQHLESSLLLNQLCNPGDNSWEAIRTPLQQGLQTSADHGDEKRCCYDLLGELQLSLLHPLLALTAKLSLQTNNRVKIYLNETIRTTTKQAESLVCEWGVLCFTFH